MLTIFLSSLLIGAMAGFFAGLFGLGGGIIIVPLLSGVLVWQNFNADMIMITAIATSLATIIPTSLSSIYAHHQRRAIIWPRVLRLSSGILIGSVGGALIAENIAENSLRWLFIVYLFYIASAMLSQFKLIFAIHWKHKALDFFSGNIIGAVSNILGIGGGTLTVPYLLGQRFEMKQAVGTSSACGFPIAVSGMFSYIWLGWGKTHIHEYSLGYIYLPAFAGIICCSVLTAPLGAKIAHKIAADKLKRYFALLLYIVALKMLQQTNIEALIFEWFEELSKLLHKLINDSDLLEFDLLNSPVNR